MYTTRGFILACLLLLGVPAHSQTNRWEFMAEQFNRNFKRLAELSCAGAIPYKFAPSDVVRNYHFDANFAVIIKALEKGGCRKIETHGPNSPGAEGNVTIEINPSKKNKK